MGFTKEFESWVVEAFLWGGSIAKIARKGRCSRQDVEDILRKYVRPGGRKG